MNLIKRIPIPGTGWKWRCQTCHQVGQEDFRISHKCKGEPKTMKIKLTKPTLAQMKTPGFDKEVLESQHSLPPKVEHTPTPPCCLVEVDDVDMTPSGIQTKYIVRYCPLHENSNELLQACKEFMRARNQRQWDEAAQSIKEAIAKAEGK